MSIALGSTIVWSVACLALGFFIGFRRGESKQGRQAVDYWLTAGDGRVNWSRVTAMVGLSAYVAIIGVFLHVYDEKNGVGMSEELLFALGSALGMAGINLGQYITSKKLPSVGSSSSTTTTSRSSQAVPAPPTGDP